MKQFIEFKLHAGNVPYFADKVLSISPINNRYYGISKDDDCCYLPTSIVTLTQQEFIDKINTNGIIKILDTENIDDTVELLDQDKLDYINNWITENYEA